MNRNMINSLDCNLSILSIHSRNACESPSKTPTPIRLVLIQQTVYDYTEDAHFEIAGTKEVYRFS